MEITQDKVLAQMLFVVTELSICNKSTSFQQEFQQLQEIISDWELSRLQARAAVKKEMPCKQKENSQSRQKVKEYQISEHPHAFTGCQDVIPSNNHPEDTPLFCNDYKPCIELEVENRGSTGGVGVMSTVNLCLLMREGGGRWGNKRERECETKEERKENKKSG